MDINTHIVQSIYTVIANIVNYRLVGIMQE